jgi:hypothetical protein
MEYIKNNGLEKTLSYLYESYIPENYFKKLKDSMEINDDMIFELMKNDLKLKMILSNKVIEIASDKLIYIKKINMSEQQKIGFDYQLNLLDIKISVEKSFYMYIIMKTKKIKEYIRYPDTYCIASILLNENSMNFLTILAKNKEFYKKNEDKMKLLLIISKYMLKNFYAIDINMMVILSSSILFLYGVRRYNDIDLDIAYSKDVKTRTNNFMDKIIKLEKIVKDKYNTKFDYWPEYDFKNAKKPNLEFIDIQNKYNIKVNSEIFFHPKYNFYFLGLKFHTIEYETFRRFLTFTYRCHGPRFVDLYYMNTIFDMDITIPYPVDFNKNNSFDDIKKSYKLLYNKTITDNIINDFIKKTQGKKYNIDIKIKYT